MAIDSGRGSSLLDRAIADRRQLNTITLPDFSDPETGHLILAQQIHDSDTGTVLDGPGTEQAASDSSTSSSLSRTESPLHLFMSPQSPHPHPKTDTFVWPHATTPYCDHVPGPCEPPFCKLFSSF
ncbi:hypothetical protein lerEdw1_013042 [Lerista edwardsae]|nr:hypothetical protein lerEdw1_013042 [Lerista edwardsae]